MRVVGTVMAEVTIITDMRLLRLLQLSSASLPVGGYAFSQGLEYAIDSGWLKNEEQVAEWIQFVMYESLSQVDLPLLQRLTRAAQQQDAAQFDYWNAYSLACRETMELRLTETAMGDALVRLMNSLAIPMPTTNTSGLSFVSAFAIAAVHWQITLPMIQVGYLWSWLESQVAAATKLVPLGQTSAQKLLVSIGEHLAAVIERAEQVEDEQIGSSLPGLAMASSWHETQYSRLFRS
jgi:urease accessory protein